MALLKIVANGKEIEVPAIKGDNGVSVAKTEINQRGELIITLSDNTVSNLGVVVGAKGDKGDTGATGATGAAGDKGDKGDKGDPGIYIGSGDMPDGYSVQLDLEGDTYSIINEINDDTDSEIPTCEAVKNYVISILDDLDSKLQELL